MSVRVTVLSALLLGTALLYGCGDTGGDTGEANIGVSTQALSKADVASVKITVSGDNISPDIVHNLNKTGGQWKGVINHIPVGTNRTFLAQAYNSSSALIYAGSATGVTITKGTPVTVVILLQQSNPPTPFANKAPSISALTASSTAVGPSETVALTVTASDPDTDPLTYSWSDDCSGSFSSASVVNPTWTAPATAGSCTLSISVSDGKGAQVGLSLSVGVQTYYSKGTAKVQVSFNTWPDVTQVAANPGHVAVSGTVTLTTTAVDNDGDSLGYSWSDGSCGGTFGSTTAASTTWTAPATAPTSGNCTLSISVSDGNGGSNTGAVEVKVGPLATPNVAPVIASSYQSVSALSNTAADTVTLRVVATDPESAALTFSWSTTAGILGTATNTGSGPYTSENTLTTSGACTTGITVTAAVSDGTNTTDVTFGLTCTAAVFEAHISAGDHSTCLGKSDGTVVCWGRNDVGQATAPAGSFSQVTAGTFHTCGLQTNGTVVCWGSFTAPPAGPFSQISASNGATCGLRSDGTVDCWGTNTYITAPPTGTSAGTFSQVATGVQHACGVLTGGTVSCWGRDYLGALTPPTGTFSEVSVGTNYSCGLRTNGTIACWGMNVYGTVTGVPSGTFSQVAVGRIHTCGVRSDGTVVCWGRNDFGESTPPAGSFRMVSAGRDHTCGLRTNGTVVCWGLDDFGQSTPPAGI